MYTQSFSRKVDDGNIGILYYGLICDIAKKEIGFVERS